MQPFDNATGPRPLSVAVSACLLGERCRYDGGAKPCAAALRLLELPGISVVPICPEAAGGLRAPRPASEITRPGPAWRVTSATGADVTRAFVEGARATLDQVRAAGCDLAVLKAKSPSCGTGLVYDGTFTGTLVPGNGVAATLLLASGVPVIDEHELARLWEESGEPGIAKALR